MTLDGLVQLPDEATCFFSTRGSNALLRQEEVVPGVLRCDLARVKNGVRSNA